MKVAAPVGRPARRSSSASVSAGASVRVLQGVHLGGEWMSQDLEETFSGGAEGTALHAVSPDLAVDLDRGRCQLAAATLFGVTPASPRALFRAGVAYSY